MKPNKKLIVVQFLVMCLVPSIVFTQKENQDEEILTVETTVDIYERLREEYNLDIEYEEFLALFNMGFDEDGVLGLLVDFNGMGNTVEMYFDDYVDYILEGNTHEDILRIIESNEVPFDPMEQLNELLDSATQEDLEELLQDTDTDLDPQSILDDLDIESIEDIVENGKALPIPQEIWDEFVGVYFDVGQIKKLLPTDGEINGFEDVAMIGAFLGVSKFLKDIQLNALISLFPEYEDEIVQHIKIAYRTKMERLTNPYLRWLDGDRNGTPNDSVHELIMTQIINSL